MLVVLASTLYQCNPWFLQKKYAEILALNV